MAKRGKSSIKRGDLISGADGQMATVEEIVRDTDSDQEPYLVVRDMSSGELMQVPFNGVERDPEVEKQYRVRADQAERPASSAKVTSVKAGGGLTDDGRLLVPLHEEELVATTREVELGAVRLLKRVETVPVEIDIPVERDQVSIERITKDEYVDVAPEVRYEGDTMIVPVIEEILVTAKRFLLREEVRITRTRIAESVHVSESVRRERLDVEEIDEKMKSDVSSSETSPL